MRVITLFLALMLALLQYPLWLGDRTLFKKRELQAQLREAEQRNQKDRDRNETLAAAVEDLRSGLSAVEETARRKLGMVREEEIFVHAPPEK